MNSNKGLGMKILDENTGATATYSGVKKLFEDIKFMLLTPKGSIYGYPEYGSDLYTMLYKTGTKATADLVSTAVFDVLSKFQGITVLNVKAEVATDKKTITVAYDIVYNAQRLTNSLILPTEV
jgi:phage baseplate assembly protein W